MARHKTSLGVTQSTLRKVNLFLFVLLVLLKSSFALEKTHWPLWGGEGRLILDSSSLRWWALTQAYNLLCLCYFTDGVAS